MKTVEVKIKVPEEIAHYVKSIREDDKELYFMRNAMLLYPFVRKSQMSRGRAAELLGVNKFDLIDFYSSISIPFINMTEEDLQDDLETFERLKEKNK